MIPEVHEVTLASFGYLKLDDVVLLSLIKSGIDDVKGLAEGSGIASRTVYRRLVVLTGAEIRNTCASNDENEVLQMALVRVRSHPHQQGKQLILTELGLELLEGMRAIINTKCLRSAQNVHTPQVW